MENLILNLNRTLSKTTILEIKNVHLSILDISLYYVEKQDASMVIVIGNFHKTALLVLSIGRRFYAIFYCLDLLKRVSGVNFQAGSQNY